MADTQRTIAQLQALLADNSTGAISPQDLRDLLETFRPDRGEISLTVAGTVSVLAQDTWYELTTGSWTLSGNEYRFDSPSAGRLRYTGAQTRAMHIACSLSFELAEGSNDTIQIAVAKNGSRITTSQQSRKISTAGDVGSTALHAFTTMDQNDYLSLLVLNDDAADDITIRQVNLFAMGMAT
jgi:hypothetical protein